MTKRRCRVNIGHPVGEDQCAYIKKNAYVFFLTSGFGLVVISYGGVLDFPM